MKEYDRAIVRFMQQYADEVSQKREEWTAIEFATTYYTLGIPRKQVVESFNEWYDNWLKEQEEKK